MHRALALSLGLLAAAYGCATSDNAPSTSADGGSDAGDPDTTTSVGDAASEADDAVADTDAGAVDAGSTLACPPSAAVGFTPTWKPPKPLHTGACTRDQAATVVDCAFDPSAKPAMCEDFFGDAGNSACMLCVLTDDFDTSYGPLVMHGVYAALNLGGCIAALAGDTSATGCGAKVQAISECQRAACTGCPDPSTGAQALSDYLKCQQEALSTVCLGYVDAGGCADPLIAPDGAAETCASGANTFLDRARHLAHVFCAP